ncbi:unnamed protein product [Adineta steineri]|uniref:Copper transport protein n=1 Tax=Adineta steineri TaxID=433720 RepID=A0A813UZ39_9BILA|nr:unnamed protein product [Adineta steineri]CAF3613144.1 unnamed protein product [Adineta steineri]
MNNSHVHNSNHMHHQHHDDTHHKESMTSTHNDHHSMMEMSFHTGFVETILFEPWITTTIPIFIISWIFIFILGILHEGIKEFRQSLEVERFIKRPIISDNGNENELECMNIESLDSTRHTEITKSSPSYIERIFLSVLYAIHLALSYILMLIAMTFNIYLFFAIIFGLGIGHLVFTRNRVISSTSNNEHHT